MSESIVYLVLVGDYYIDHEGRRLPTGLCIPHLRSSDWIGNLREARRRAELFDGVIHKFRIHIHRAVFKGAPIRRDQVPREGDVAFSSGWGLNSNPYAGDSVENMRWTSDWWRANADAFESHVHEMAEDMEDRGER